MHDFYSVVRWIEYQPVVQRLIEIWPNIKRLVKFWHRLPKSSRPSSKRYEFVVETVVNPLVVAKLLQLCCKFTEAILEKISIRTANNTVFQERVTTIVQKCFGDNYSARHSE